MPVFARILALLLAVGVFVNGVSCGCAAPVATTQPTEPPCCQKDSPAPASPDKSTPDDCPHCKQTRVAADPLPAVLKHTAVATTPVPAVLVAIPLLPPLRPSVVRSADESSFAVPPCLPLRLHCAFVL